MTVIRCLATALLMMSLVACASQMKDEAYQKAQLGPPLQLPPGLSEPAADESIKALEGDAAKGASYSDYACDCKNGKKRPDTTPADEAASGLE